MTVGPIRAIARREINDMLTDWRILLPIFILTFVLPTLLIAATNFVIRFIDDPNTIPLLVPFVMLLIGFIPASFSLIAALESFVGERERNSLEALLSMPISDSQLYLAKLISSLMPPLLSSYTAMSVFGLLLRLHYPDLFQQGLSPEILLVVVLLISAKAILMVASAVIISSHTTSVRAANLLASFVLLPTASIVQLEAILFIARTERSVNTLWALVALLFVIALVLVRTGMGAFNREEILSREHEQLNLKHIGATFRKFLREYHPAGVSPDLYSAEPFSLSRFYRRELPLILHEYRLPLGVALVAALAGMVSGGLIGQLYQVPLLDQILKNVGTTPDPSVPLAARIFFNNFRVSLLSSLLSLFTFGSFAFLVPAVAFAQIGFVTSSLSARGGSWLALGDSSPLQFVLAYVLPHGIIELPAALLASALGIRIGASLMAPPKGFTVGQNIMWALAQFFKVWALVVLPLLLVGSLIEGLITPRIVMALYGR
ncbi:MAG TPA: stage II sporulation protein M [Roseiflexaceae bacterium]|nr:stage II sporulation protein M [Roseiflexaceae bacterium]